MILHNEATTENPLCSAVQQAMDCYAREHVVLLKKLVLEVGQAPDLETALTAVIRSVCQHQNWQYGEAWQFNSSSAALRRSLHWTALNVDATAPNCFTQLSEDRAVAPGSGMPGRIWTSQQFEWHTDVLEASAGCPSHQEAARCGFQTTLGIPLVANRRTLSVLIFFCDKAVQEDPHLVEQINAISGPIGMLVQQRQAERALRDSEARFHAFMDHSPAMVSIKDPQGRYVYVNRTLENNFKVSQAELIGKTDAACLPEQIARRVHQNDRQVLLSNQAQTVVEVVPAPDGVDRYWQVLKFPFADGKGQQFVGGVAFDITLQRQFEEKLAAEKELAQVTLKSIGDAVITADAGGRVQYLNPVAETLTGWSQAEAQGEPLSAVFHIIDETTRQPIADPVMPLPHGEKAIELAGHTALVARDGTEISIEKSAAPIQTHDGQLVGMVVVFHDVSKTRQLTQQLSWQASHDALTGLLNRRAFDRRVMQAVDNAHADHKVHALCYIDLDNFKIVNDTCGHAAGDRLLEQVSMLIEEHVRATDVLARLGGDEFGLLLKCCPLEHAARLVYELKEKLQALRFSHDDRFFSVGVSIGVTAITATTESVAAAMSNADAACHVAKRKGRSRVHIHQLDDAELAQQRGEIQWAAYIAEALEADRFQLYYQPILSLNPACLESEHYEVLLRLRDQTGAIVSPAAFIPAAERYSLMPRIDRWVIQTLFASRAGHCQQVWLACEGQLYTGGHLYSINLSGASIDDDEFIQFLKAQFLQYQIPPALICFEITETAAIANLPKAVQFISELRQLGCQFALDDFGSGMSSFAYLKTLPIDYLKIDGCFIQNIVDNKIDLAMVTAIHQIAQVMNIRTVAEFVENEDILTTLKLLGIDYAQGYSIARPAPLLASTAVSNF